MLSIFLKKRYITLYVTQFKDSMARIKKKIDFDKPQKL